MRNTMVSVLTRHHPELEPILRDVSNAFAPWPGTASSQG